MVLQKTTLDRINIGTKVTNPSRTYLIKETISISPEKEEKHSMSIVFKAKDEKTGKEFAIKFPLLDGSENKETIPHFDREKQIARAMRKFNSFFVSSVDDGMFNGLPYFVMELFGNSKPLGEYVFEHRLDWKGAKRILDQICEALFILHSRVKIIHRDIKPQSILISESASGVNGTLLSARIFDFGSAACMDQAALIKFAGETSLFLRGAAAAATNPMVAMGKPGVIDPETFCANRYDYRLDIQAFGLLMRDILSGELGTGFTPGSLLGEISPFVGQSTIRNIPSMMDEICARAIVSISDPKEGYQKIEDVKRALEGVT